MVVVKKVCGEVVNKLIEKEYSIKTVVAAGNIVTGINIDKETMVLAPNEEKTITVTPEWSSSEGAEANKNQEPTRIL